MCTVTSRQRFGRDRRKSLKIEIEELKIKITEQQHVQVEASVLVHIDPILGCVFLSIPLHAVFNIESHIMSFTSTFLYYPCRLGCLCHG